MSMRRMLLGLIVLASCSSLMMGCSIKKPDEMKAELLDPKGLAIMDTVLWRGINVGTVRGVSHENGKAIVRFILFPEFEGVIHSDVTARATRGFAGQERPRLELYGGLNTKAGLLTSAHTIQEAAVWEGFDRRQLALAGALLLAVILVLFVFKSFGFLIRFALFVIFAGGAVWLVKLQWDRYKHHVVSPEVEAQLSGKAYELLQHPTAQAAWQGIVEDAGTVYRAGMDVTGKARKDMATLVRDRLGEKIANLISEGEQVAADELKRLESTMDNMVGESSR